MPALWPALPDLRRVEVIGLDTEERDDGLLASRGSAWPWGGGHICGLSVAYRVEAEIRAHYFPICHPNSPNLDRQQVFHWLRDHVAAGVRFVTQNGVFDWGWLRTEAGIIMPPSDQLEEIGALATIVDENRKRYSLDALCAWRGLPGKDEALLKEAAIAAGFPKRAKPQAFIWQLPASVVGPYAEADAASTLALFESLDPILDQEGTRAAYRLECDLLPMCLEMRRRGIRVDTAAAEEARDQLLGRRDAVLAELSEKLGTGVSMGELNRTAWRAKVFDQHKIPYPRTEKGNPSFTAGNSGWMPKHPHWLPRLIVRADKYHNAAVNVLETYILGHAVNGRVFAEIHPHRSDEGGTRSLRFSYSSPPLQLMPAHDKELAPHIRGVFLPEEGEYWAKSDQSQQEFRIIVHYAARHELRGAKDMAARYRDNPDTDIHKVAAELIGRPLERQLGKGCNFAKFYGAGVRKFAAMIGKPVREAQALFDEYDRQLPFVSQLSRMCERAVRRNGYLALYDNARRHWTDWAPGGRWEKGAGPCPREEAEARVSDPGHPWYRKQLYRVDCRNAMNALIQGSAARHTKLWMRAVYREGIIPLLQMHDSLDLSVSSPEQAELVARLGCEAVQLDVPMKVDVGYGRTWGEAEHAWEERDAAPEKPAISTAPIETDSIEDIVDDVPVSSEVPAWIGDQIETATVVASAAEPPPPATEPPNPATPPPQPRSGGNGYGGNGFGGDGYQRGEREPPKSSPSAIYIYKDSHGAFYMKVNRLADKAGFPTYHWNAGGWVKGWPKTVVPYRLPELIAAPLGALVCICEGEKDANNTAALGFIATTNPGGAKQWQPELAQWFKGRERVCILEHNDDPGRKHTGLIMASLRAIVPTIAVVTFPELSETGDVSDWIEQGGNYKLLLARIEEAFKRSSTRRYVAVNLATSPQRAYKWVWVGHLVRGNLELLAGIPSIGKSQVHCQYVAYVTTGRAWPNGAPGIEPCRALMLTAEDNTADTLKPRLTAAGANLSLVEELRWVKRNNRDEMFLLAEDLDKLEDAIRDFGDVGLVTLDPITAYLGSGKHFDSHKASDVRSQLSPLKQFAERTGVAFSAVTHPPKNASLRALDHFIGSQAFIAAARIGHACFPEMEIDPAGNKRETDRALFTNVKPLGGPRQPTLAYRIVTADAGFDSDTGLPLTAPVIQWEGEVDITADQASAAARSTKAARPNAKEFLLTILTNGPVLQSKIIARGQECGFSLDQLKRAKTALKVKSIKAGGSGDPWVWMLPEDATTESEGET